MSKIAILHPKATIKGGAIKTLFEIGRILQESGNEIKFFVLCHDASNCFPEISASLDIKSYETSGFRNILSYVRMAFSLRRYDVVIAGNTPMHFVGVLAKVFHPRLRVYWYLQNIPVYYLPQNKGILTTIKKGLEKVVIPFLTRLITNSSFIRDEARKDFGKDSEILYPAIDTDFFSNGHAVLEENQTLFCYSRLAKGKNVELAIDAFIELQKKYHGLKLVIGGDGEEKEMLVEKAQFYENIQFLGEITQEEAKANFERCTVFLFTSIIDAFGLTILEAMSMEKATVALATGGALELIGNGENGYLGKDRDEFIGYIDDLLSDEEKRKGMGMKGRQWAVEHFSLESMKKSVIGLFK